MSERGRRLRSLVLALVAFLVGLEVLGARALPASFSAWALAPASPTAASARSASGERSLGGSRDRAATATSAPQVTSAPQATAAPRTPTAGPPPTQGGPGRTAVPTSAPGQGPSPAKPTPVERPDLATVRGVNLSGGELNDDRLPGKYDKDYVYPSARDLEYYRDRDVRLVRLPFRWERLQRSLQGPLESEELDRIAGVLAAARARDMGVILVPHNYGRYREKAIGAQDVPIAAFADFWRKLAQRFRDEPAVWAYGLMHEPNVPNGRWPAAAQAAVDAIRSVDTTRAILVAGEKGGRADAWPADNGKLAIADPADNLLYEAYQYFDDESAGRYERDYDRERAHPEVGVERLGPFTRWLQERKARGFVGAFGVPDDDPRWLEVLDRFLEAMDEADLGGAYWLGGPWSDDDRLSVEPRKGRDRPQMTVLATGKVPTPTATARSAHTLTPTATRPAEASPTGGSRLGGGRAVPIVTPVAPGATATAVTSTTSAAGDPIRFERRVSSAQATGQANRVPPRSVVQVEIAVSTGQPVARAVLADYFPAGWAVVDTEGASLSEAGDRVRIAWELGDLPAGARVTRTYSVSSPASERPAEATRTPTRTAPRLGRAEEHQGAPSRSSAMERRAAARAQAQPADAAPASTPTVAPTPTPTATPTATPAPAGGPVVEEFLATLESTAGQWQDEPYPVEIGATMEAVDPPLHAPDVLVGSTTYNTINTSGYMGTVQTATASAASKTTRTLADAAGITTWVSDPVPPGATWTFGNPWTWNMYVKASGGSSVRVYLSGQVYRIDTNGQATLLRTTPNSARIDNLPTATYGNYTWTDSSVPASVLNAGERIGVLVRVTIDGGECGSCQVILGFDHTTTPSAVTWAYTEQGGGPTPTPTPSAGANVAHYRIGYDAPLASPSWRSALDTAAGPIAAGDRFQVRFQVYNSGAALYPWQPRLESATSTSGPWTALPTSSGSTPFFVALSSNFANGDPYSSASDRITAPALGTLAWAWQDGVGYESTNPPATPWDLNAVSYTELVYNVQMTSNASAGTPYYFRLSNNGTALASYAFYASVTTQSGATPGGPPTGPTPTPQPPAHNFNTHYSADTSACAACHRVHTAQGREALRKAWPEEQTCYTCHDGTIAPNIRGEFQKTYRMPIEQTSFVHRTGEARTGSSFSGTNRHVECEDCHNPHEAGAVSHTLGTAYAAGPQQGVWGVSASWADAWTTPTYSVTNRITYQYELCFTCHSSWAYGGSPPNSPSGGFAETDQSKEFSPYNASYHPVTAVGKNPFQLQGGGSYASSLLNGLTPSSNLVCSDCHGSNSDSSPKGPHGSTYSFILRGKWDRTVGADRDKDGNNYPDNQNGVCFKCHDRQVYGAGYRVNEGSPWDSRTGFSGNGKNLHSTMVGARNKANGDAPIVCMDCHIAVPHGWNRARLIGFTGDGGPYINRPYSGGLTTIDTWSPSGAWTFNSCGTAMDSCK